MDEDNPLEHFTVEHPSDDGTGSLQDGTTGAFISKFQGTLHEVNVLYCSSIDWSLINQDLSESGEIEDGSMACLRKMTVARWALDDAGDGKKEWRRGIDARFPYFPPLGYVGEEDRRCMDETKRTILQWCADGEEQAAVAVSEKDVQRYTPWNNFYSQECKGGRQAPRITQEEMQSQNLSNSITTRRADNF